jgi:hypothetical protein
MILFLHSAFASSSSLVMFVRETLELSDEYTDRFIIDTFTISVAGYYTEDEEFDQRKIFTQINEFISESYDNQQAIFSKSILGTSNPTLLALKGPKLNILGVDAGGSLALIYGAQFSDNCNTITLLDSTNNYKGFLNKIRRMRTNRLLKLPLSKIQTKIQKTKDWHNKLFLTLLQDNTLRKGIEGFVNFMYDFDFGEIYRNLTLSNQHNFNKIQILSLISSKKSLPTRSSQKQMAKLLHPDNNLVRAKHTIILVDESKKNHFDYKVVQFPSRYILDNDNLPLLTTIIKEFYKQNLI